MQYSCIFMACSFPCCFRVFLAYNYLKRNLIVFLQCSLTSLVHKMKFVFGFSLRGMHVFLHMQRVLFPEWNTKTQQDVMILQWVDETPVIMLLNDSEKTQLKQSCRSFGSHICTICFLRKL